MKYYRRANTDKFTEIGTISLKNNKVEMSADLFPSVSFLGVKATPKDGDKFMKILALQTSTSSYTKCVLEDSDKVWAPKGITPEVLKKWATELTAEKRGK